MFGLFWPRVMLTAALVWLLGAEFALAGRRDDTLIWSTERDNPIADPFYLNTRELVIIGHHAWDTLVALDPKTGTLGPLLATSWAWIDDTTLDMDLRQGVKFHSGKEMDAGDVAYTLNHVTNRANAVLNYTFFNWIKSAEILQKHKVRIHLSRPFPPALAYLAGDAFIMQNGHYDSAPLKPDGKKDFGAVKPNGTGPYIVSEIKSGEYILLKRFDGYFKDGIKGSPKIGQIKFRTIKDNNTRASELLTGAVDWMWEMPRAVAERLVPVPNLKVESANTLRISYLQFDVMGQSAQKFFMDKRVRQAVAHAVNRDAIITNLVAPGSTVPFGPCHPEQFACASDIPQYEYNPAKAKKLLVEAGYADGFEFDLYAFRDREIVEAIIGDLSKVGLRPKLNFMQYVAFLEMLRRGKVPLGYAAWGSNSIRDVTAAAAHFFAGGPDDQARDPKVIAGIEKADRLLDPVQRQNAWRDVLGRIQSEAYWLSMFTHTKYQAWSRDLDYTPTSDEIPQFYAAKWK